MSVWREERGSAEENAPLVAAARIVVPQQGGTEDDGGGGSADGGDSHAIPPWRRAALAFWNNGVACVLFAALAFSLASTIVKLIQEDVPVFQIVVCRAMLSALITTLTCKSQGVPVFGSTAPMELKLARGIIGATAMVCSYESIVHLPLSDSTVIFFLSPAMTALLGWPLLGERFGWYTAGGCGASLAGVVLVAQPWSSGVKKWNNTRMLGMTFGLVGSLLAAGAYICIRQIGKREHPLTVAMYFHTFSFLGSVVPLAVGYPKPAVLPTMVQAVLLLVLACCSFTANLLVTRAFQIELAAKASAVNFTQVIFAWTIGGIFFGEPLTLLGVTGTGLIALGVIAVNLDKMARQPAAPAAASHDSPAKEAGASEQPPQGQPVLIPDQQRPRWWQRLWGRDARGEEEGGLDYSGRFKAKTSFKTEHALLPQYSAVSSGSPRLIQSSRETPLSAVQLATAPRKLQPLPAEGAA